MNCYLKVLEQYADFKGRARRTEYWMFTLFNFIFGVLAIILGMVLGLAFPFADNALMYTVYMLSMFIPSLAVTVRRLHDIGKSGFTFFIVLIPFIGAILMLIFLTTDSQSGHNKWGANPKKINY